MKIVFLCGALEPGRDGVGDYTQNLAIELIRQGYQASIVAFYDPHISTKYEDLLVIDGVELRVLRLPSAFTTKLRFDFAKAWIEERSPKWISLQFVPYSFDTKGLPFSFILLVKRLTKGSFVHLMYHESWIGRGSYFNLKRNFYSRLQKELVKLLLVMLCPDIIHTHLPLYKKQLESIGWKSHSLPLFSNIKVVPEPPDTICNDTIRVGLFSQIEAVEPVIKFLDKLKKQAMTSNKQFEILLIGGNKKRVQKAKKEFEKLESLRYSIKITGHLCAQKISSIIQKCTLGVTPVPFHALGKSGSVAAFIAHGVPVAVPIVQKTYGLAQKGFFSNGICSAIILEPTLSHLKSKREAALASRNEILLTNVAEKLISDLLLLY